MLVTSAALEGCGRRGPLELPPGAPGSAEQSGQNGPDTAALADRQAAALNDAEPPGIVQRPNEVVQTTTTSAALAAKPPSRAINGPPSGKPGTFLLDPLL